MKNNNFKNLEQASSAAAEKFAELAAAAIKDHGFFAAALPGGKTPQEFFEILAGEFADKIDWQKCFLFLSDERNVPYDSADSNFAVANELLFSKIDLPSKNINRFQTELGAARAAEEYETAILDFFQNHDLDAPIFDLIMLGIGTDGHVASLFPGSAALDEKFNLVAVSQSPDGMERLTMTFPLINRAAQRIILAGSDKSEILRKVLAGGAKIPAQMIAGENTEIYSVSE